MGVFKQGDVLKQMLQKGYKISFRMYLNLCNAKFSRIDVENRVYGEVILSLHFSIAFSNMLMMVYSWTEAIYQLKTIATKPYGSSIKKVLIDYC